MTAWQEGLVPWNTRYSASWRAHPISGRGANALPLNQGIADHHRGAGELADQFAYAIAASNRQTGHPPSPGAQDHQVVFAAKAMNGRVDAGPPHDHDVKPLLRNPRRSLADQLLFYPVAILPTEAGVVHVQQGDPNPLILRG